MEKEDKEFIGKNFSRLIDCTDCNETVLASLVSFRLLTKWEVEKLKATHKYDGATASAFFLYDIIQCKNNSQDTTFDLLMLALEQGGQSEAVKILEEHRLRRSKKPDSDSDNSHPKIED